MLISASKTAAQPHDIGHFQGHMSGSHDTFLEHFQKRQDSMCIVTHLQNEKDRGSILRPYLCTEITGDFGIMLTTASYLEMMWLNCSGEWLGHPNSLTPYPDDSNES